MSLAYVVQHEITSGRLENLHLHKYSKFFILHYYFAENKNEYQVELLGLYRRTNLVGHSTFAKVESCLQEVLCCPLG